MTTNPNTKDFTVTTGSLFSVHSYVAGQVFLFLVLDQKDTNIRGVRFLLNPDRRSAQFVQIEDREKSQLLNRVGSVKKHVIRAIRDFGKINLMASDIVK